MLPLELKEEILKLPETNDPRIVIITGTSLRHKRFSYRIQKEFGGLVSAWYELDVNQTVKYAKVEKKQEAPTPPTRISKVIKVIPYFLKHGLIKTVTTIMNRIRDKIRGKDSFVDDGLIVERKLFESEIADLKPFAVVKPKKINPLDTHCNEFFSIIKNLDPYFLLTLGGPLYKTSLLKTVRGVAINQHAGHSPNLKGANTIEWALYHRNINHISSTVHITTSGADAGPILRRSNPCISEYDSPRMIFVRVVALGTELMIEAVQDIIDNKSVKIYRQPHTMGRTFIIGEFDSNMRETVERDFKSDYLQPELRRLRVF